MYLITVRVDGYGEEKNGSKYFSFWFYGWKQRSIKKYTELWSGIKNKIETINAINGGKKGEYGKDFMKIKFDRDDNLLLNKQLKLHSWQ